MLKQAEAVLGYNLLKLCLEGPKEKLDDTVFSQPALYVAGLAAVEKLRQDDPAAVNDCTATAGQPSNTCKHTGMCVCIFWGFVAVFPVSNAVACLCSNGLDVAVLLSHVCCL